MTPYGVVDLMVREFQHRHKVTDEERAVKKVDDWAAESRDLADKELHRSGAAIRDAAEEQTPLAQRGERLGQAAEDLARARQRLEAMKQAADRIAAQRRTVDWLRRLADRQEALAARTADSSADTPDSRRYAASRFALWFSSP